MAWAQPKETRDQLVLFPEKLDDAIPADHPVRTIWAILQKVNWTRWEKQYVLTKGQPPIHPSILVGVILYGLLKRIRTSRALEEALQVRMDFRWFVEGRSIDHSTIAKFRTAHPELLKDVFVQIGLIAEQMGYLTLVTLGYDGTRFRASNRRSGTRTPEELRKAKQELAEEFAAHLQATAKAQAGEDEIFDAAEKATALANLEARGKDLQRQSDRVEAALAEIQKIEESGKKVPARIPITDPECRIAKNKEGGFGTNYNPTVTVDADSGLIAAHDVISGIDEQSHMHEAIDEVRRDFLGGDPERPIEVLADGLMATGKNIAACEGKNVEFFSPAGPDNPAYREDPSEPIAEDRIADLPLRGKKPKKGKADTRTFDKSAFLYDAQADVYYCPMGKTLERRSQRSKSERYLYRIAKSQCAACPLRAKCFKNSRNQYGRRIENGKHERAKQAHAAKMQTDNSRKKYARRAAVTERPFALIKRGFGVREFLVRGLTKVRAEWCLLCIAHNLHRILGLKQQRARAAVP